MRKTKATSPAKKRFTVPRDPDAGHTPDDTTPPRHHSAEGVRARVRGSLDPESPPARALHEHPPKGRGQLDVGTGGDAARPGKTGLSATSINPRGNYGRS